MKYRYRKEHEMKNSGVEWLGMIPKEWMITKLKYLGQISSGESIKSQELVDNGKYPIFGGNGLAGFTNKYNINNDKIIIGRVGAYCGNVRYTKERLWITDNALIVTLNRNENYRYLSKLLESVRLNRLNVSTAQPLITGTKVMNYDIPKPLNEENRIADFLDQKTAEFDLVIEKKEKLIERLEEAKKSLISEVVTGKKQVISNKSYVIGEDGQEKEEIRYEVRNRAVHEMKDSGNIFFPMQPLTWKIVKFKYITDKIIDGAHFTPTYVDEGIPFLRVTDITKNQECEIELKNVKYIPKEEHLELTKRCNPQKGDLLVSKNGTIGVPKVIDWDWEFSIFVSLCLIKVKTKINPYLISYYFKGNVFNTQIAFGGKKTSIMNLHLDKIREFELIIPSKNIQDDIIKYLDKKITEFDSIIQKNKEQIANIKEAKQSLISEAVTGKIEIM